MGAWPRPDFGIGLPKVLTPVSFYRGERPACGRYANAQVLVLNYGLHAAPPRSGCLATQSGRPTSLLIVVVALVPLLDELIEIVGVGLSDGVGLVHGIDLRHKRIVLRRLLVAFL